MEAIFPAICRAVGSLGFHVGLFLAKSDAAFLNPESFVKSTVPYDPWWKMLLPDSADFSCFVSAPQLPTPIKWFIAWPH